MRTIGDLELRQLQLDILRQVHTYCQNNGLKYFLAGGTLIGAVRHKGYIPWDDDIDLFMPRKDYDLFVANYNQQKAATTRVISLETRPD